MNVLEFHKIVRNKKEALSYLRVFCWPDGNIACPKCGDTKIYRIKNDRYRCSSCKYSFSDFTQRWFGQLRLGPQKSLWIIKLFELQLSALECSKQLGISYGSCLKAYNLIRTSVRYPAEGRGVFAGCRVEVDEAYFGGRRKGRRGRGAEGKVAVFGMKTRDGVARMVQVKDTSAETLVGLIEENIDKGSIVYTDKYKSYNDLKVVGYRHKRINHRKRFVNGKTHTNGVEGLWSYVKEGLAKHHGISREKFPLYLSEQEFRFNHREESLFELLVEKMCSFVPQSE